MEHRGEPSLTPDETRLFIEGAGREITRLKWYEKAKTFAEGLLRLQKEVEQAERARDAAIAEAIKAGAEIANKQAKYEAEVKSALADLARVLKEKTDASELALGKARAELDRVIDQTALANQVRELAEGQRDAFREEAEREAAGITARLEAMRAEERDAKARFSGVVAALKG